MTNEAKCPKCGEPARIAIILKARVRYLLEDKNGRPGKILGMSKKSDESLDGDVAAYECSGGHVWQVGP